MVSLSKPAPLLTQQLRCLWWAWPQRLRALALGDALNGKHSSTWSRFVAHCHEQHHWPLTRYSQDDLTWAWQTTQPEAADDIPLLVAHYRDWVRAFDLQAHVVEAGPAPSLTSRQAAMWRPWSAWVAQDAVLTLLLADRQAASQSLAWLAWDSLAPVKDRGLWLRGDAPLSDNHVHLHGSYDKHLAWLTLMHGIKPAHEALRPRFVVCRGGSPAWPWVLREADARQRQDEASFFESVGKAWQVLWRHALAAPHPRDARARNALYQALEQLAASQQRGSPKLVSKPLGLQAQIDGDRQLFALERWALATAWSALLEHLPPAVEAHLSTQLDLYLHGRQWFLRECQHLPHTPPGLRQFKTYLSRAGGHVPSSKLDGPVRQVRQALTYPVSHLARHPRLGHVELRIAPLPNLGAYISYFKHWLKLLPELKVHRRDGTVLQLRFVVHFLRPEQRLKTPKDWLNARIRLDQATALLHRFRATQPDLAQWVVGVDVANLERDCPPALALPYLRLLRRPDLLSDAAEARSHHELLPWRGSIRPCEDRHPPRTLQRWLATRHLSKVPDVVAGLAPLGLTYHVGEEVVHPVDGQRQVADVLRYGGLQAGDRLGHAVALGRYEAHPAAVAMPSLGIESALADLLWLWESLQSCPESAESQHQLLDRRWRECLGQAGWPAGFTWQHMTAMRDIQHQTPGLIGQGDDWSAWCNEHRISGLPVPVWYGDSRHHQESTARFAPEAVFAGLEGACEWARLKLLRDLAEKSITIEMNLSSNWATHAWQGLSQHPLLRSQQAGDPLPPLSLSTDDPGVFHTRLDLESGLALEALLDLDMEAQAARTLVRTWHEHGRQSSFGDEVMAAESSSE